MNLKDFHTKVDRVMQEETDSYHRFLDAAQNHEINKSNGNLIIYVEDDPDQVSMFKTVLACYSTPRVLTAFTAEDGRHLIERKRGRIKCVVMDVDLADDTFIGLRNGMSLLKWIRATYPDLPLVVFTAHVELVDELKIEFPSIEVIVKASDMENVVRVIEKQMQGVA